MSEFRPKVSVIMPCYNHEKYVGVAIESVLNQTYDNIELIVSDNGCTDGSYGVISQYRDRIKIVRLEKNDVNLCRKKMLEVATGDFIANMTSDDYWEINKLEEQIAAFNDNPELILCTTWTLLADDDLVPYEDQSKNVFLSNNRSRYEWMYLFLTQGNCLAWPSALMRRSTWDVIVKRGYRQLEDLYFWIQVVQMGEVYVVQKPLVKFRWHVGGQNRNLSAPIPENNVRTQNETVDIIEHVFETISDEFFYNTFYDQLICKERNDRVTILCEKFFILLQKAKEKIIYQQSVLRFYYSHYLEMEDRLINDYGFDVSAYRELSGTSGMPNVVMRYNYLMDYTNNVTGEKEKVFTILNNLVRSEKVNSATVFSFFSDEIQERIEELTILMNTICKVGMTKEGIKKNYSALVESCELLIQEVRSLRLYLVFLGIDISEQESNTFEELINVAKKETIDLQEAIIPFVEYILGKLTIFSDESE